jgi:hypothetical protein
MSKLFKITASRLICFGSAKRATMAVDEPGIQEPDSELNFA